MWLTPSLYVFHVVSLSCYRVLWTLRPCQHNVGYISIDCGLRYFISLWFIEKIANDYRNVQSAVFFGTRRRIKQNYSVWRSITQWHLFESPWCSSWQMMILLRSERTFSMIMRPIQSWEILYTTSLGSRLSTNPTKIIHYSLVFWQLISFQPLSLIKQGTTLLLVIEGDRWFYLKELIWGM